MKTLIKDKHFLFLILVFTIAEIIVNPIADFPLNDDWSYAKALLEFDKTSEFNLGIFPAMTLCSHVLWGFVFVKIFGFSFTVLRFSTIISALIGLLFLNKLVIKITNNKMYGLIACLALLFNPLYFNLTNTYMTDVNFNTLVILCCYFAYEFFQTKRKLLLVPIFFFSVLLVLVRQYGIVVPVCFLFACLFIKEKKWLYVSLALIVTILVFAVFKIYENYLHRILPKDSIYKFSGGIHIMSSEFWNNFFIALQTRYKTVILHVLLYSFPIAVIFLRDIFRNFKTATIIFVCLANTVLVFFLFRNEDFPFQNIFTNMKLGPETFYQSFNGFHHAKSETFAVVMNIIKYLFSSVTLITVTLVFMQPGAMKKIVSAFKPEIIFLVTLFFAYIFMMLITESYFDRYHIPLITIAIILFARLNKKYQINYKLAVIPLLCMFYVSVFGTRDYLELNRKRWEAYYYLANVKHLKNDEINGGLEVNCWVEESKSGWFNFHDLNVCDYLIQFEPEKGFELFKEYEFQRYFPYKKDKINIFAREGNSK